MQGDLSGLAGTGINPSLISCPQPKGPHRFAPRDAHRGGGKLSVLAADTLPQVVEYLNGAQALDRVRVDAKGAFAREHWYEADLSEIRGQQYAKRAMEVACAGSHNILMIGPPGFSTLDSCWPP